MTTATAPKDETRQKIAPSQKPDRETATKASDTLQERLLEAIRRERRFAESTTEELVGMLLGLTEEEVNSVTIAAAHHNEGDAGDWLRTWIRSSLECDLEAMAQDLREKR